MLHPRLGCTTRSPVPGATFCSVRKTQSYNAPRRTSLRLSLPLIRRQYFSIVSCCESLRYSARRWISSSEIQTYPGPPVQQLPHCWQVNFKPSAYQGAVVDSMTSSFMPKRMVGERRDNLKSQISNL